MTCDRTCTVAWSQGTRRPFIQIVSAFVKAIRDSSEWGAITCERRQYSHGVKRYQGHVARSRERGRHGPRVRWRAARRPRDCRCRRVEHLEVNFEVAPIYSWWYKVKNPARRWR